MEIKPGKIRIDTKIIAELMGFDADNVPAPYDEIIQTELAETENYPNIKGGFMLSGNIEIIPPKGYFYFEGIKFNTGKLVIKNLKNSEKMAMFICTAGPEVSRRSGGLIDSGNLPEGYVADLVGSVLVEEAMDILQERLRVEFEQEGLRITNRYSPGYCDWKVDEQHKLFGIFPSDFCGVRLSESALMIPVKSVSGVIGIGKEVRFHKYICNACNKVNCIYRNIKYSR